MNTMNRRCALTGMAIGLCIFSAVAQVGSWYVGGEFAYSRSTTDDRSRISWTVGPEVGTFFSERWSSGVVLRFQGVDVRDEDGQVREVSSFAPGLYGRRWWRAGEHLSLFAGLDAAYGTGSTTRYGQEEVTVDNSSFAVNLNGGLTYALADRWTLLLKLAGMGYASYTEDDETTTEFGFAANGNLSSGPFAFFGVYYTFRKPK